MLRYTRRLLGALLIAVFAATAAIGLTACGSSDSSGADSTNSAASSGGKGEKVTLLMNWFPQAEHGGYFQAQATGIDQKHGVAFEILPGGPQIQTIPQVAAGKADFGVAQADQVLQARAQGLPIVEVFAAFDKSPQCMIFHANQPISGFGDLKGHTVAIAPDARTSYWAWMEPKFGLQDVKTVNSPGTLSLFKQNDNLVQQCFATSEPFYAKQQGIDAKTLLVADAGYNPYSNGLFTSEKFLKEHPDVVRNVVAAAKAGWTDFLKNPAPAKKAVVAANSDQDPDQFDFSAKTQKDLGLVGDDVGNMTLERWTTLRDQLVQAKVLKGDVDPAKAFSTDYLPQR